MDDLDLIPRPALRAWLDASGIGAGDITDVSLLTGGTQNILMRFRRGDLALVLRRPPRHKRDSSDRAMQREAQVLAALGNTAVPHPRLHGACADPAVLGASFLVMDDVAGFAPSHEIPDVVMSRPGAAGHIAAETVRALLAIRDVDITAPDLADLGRPEGWLERQVPRWSEQLASYASFENWSPDVPGIDDLGRWLLERTPTAWRPGLMHGDFHLANILFDRDTLDVAAVLDWELATLGAPMIDLGHLLATWPDPDEPRTKGLPRYPDGFPDRAGLIALYEAAAPDGLEDLPWFHAFACYRLAVLLEGTHARAQAGRAPRDVGDRLHAIAQSLIDQARTVAA